MKAVILAAGRGTRMRIFTKDKPKCMLSFLGATLLERQIRLFRETNLTNIIVVTGYMSDKIQYEGCLKVKNENYATTNMVESLFCTRNYWDEEIIVSYGDIIYEKRVLEKLIASRDDLAVVIDINGVMYFKDRFGKDFLSKTESLVIGKDGAIIDIGEPNPDLSRVQGQYIGLLKFTKKGLEALKKVYDIDKQKYWDKPWLRSRNFQNGYMTDMLKRMINLGNSVKAVCVEGGWLEFDSDNDYYKYLDWETQKQLDKYYQI